MLLYYCRKASSVLSKLSLYQTGLRNIQGVTLQHLSAIVLFLFLIENGLQHFCHIIFYLETAEIDFQHTITRFAFAVSIR